MITDTIKYFAKFPAREGVLKHFKRNDEKIAGYNDLKDYISNLGDPVVPEIEDFIFSVDTNKIVEYEKNLPGYFMLVEYLTFNGGMMKAGGSRDINFNLAISVCVSGSGRSNDDFEEMLQMQNCFTYLCRIADTMEQDNPQIMPDKKFNLASFRIAPVDALFVNFIGYTMTFNRMADLVIEENAQ